MCSFRHDEDMRAKPTPKTAPPSEPATQRGRSASRKNNLKGRSQSGKFDRQPCKDYLRVFRTKSLCDNWHPPDCHFYKSESGCKFSEKCSFAHRQVEVQLSKKKKRKSDGDKSAVAVLKDARQLGCVFQDTEPPKSSSILRESSKVLGSSRRVRAALRHANFREHKGPSVGKIHVKNSSSEQFVLFEICQKKRFQYCSDSSGTLLYLRALQGHSGRRLIDPSLHDSVIIFQTVSPSTYIILDVHSICIPSSVRD